MTSAILRMTRSLLPALVPIICFGQQNNIYSTTLPNGLYVIVVENDIVPMSTIVFTVRGGSATEDPEFAGISHLIEHLSFGGNQTYTTHEEFTERARGLGMTIGPTMGGFTMDEWVHYYFKISKDNLAHGLAFARAAVATALIDTIDLEREKQVVLNEFDRVKSNPYVDLTAEVDRKLWQTGYSRKNIMGEREVVRSAGRTAVRMFRNRYYIPNNSIIIVAGDVEHREVFSMVERIFGDWKRGEDPFALHPIPDQPPLSRSDSVILEKPVNVVTLFLRWHGPDLSRDEQNTHVADVWSFLMRQRNSRFLKRLVDGGLCSWVFCTYQTLRHTGPIIINTEMSADRYREAERAIFEEIQKLTDPDYFSEEQIETAKRQIEIERLYSRENPSLFALQLGQSCAQNGNLDYYAHYMDNVRKVTRRDIDSFVEKYLLKAPSVKGVIVSPEERKQIFPESYRQ